MTRDLEFELDIFSNITACFYGIHLTHARVLRNLIGQKMLANDRSTRVMVVKIVPADRYLT
jgi:hypothetical protein